jgi:urease accessory protein
MAWRGTLSLRYSRQAARTVVHDRHDGPLRILRSFYPEGGACHTVLVHPPGGLVGGDSLHVDVDLAEGTHALLTTPGATRFYRSLGAVAEQDLSVKVGAGGRFEWLPLETLAYSGCVAENRMRYELAPGAEMIGWDVTALGLPASGQPFVAGSFAHRIELPGRWLERGVVAAADARLLDSPLGWAGHRVLATLWFAAGSPLNESRREALLDSARAVCTGSALARSSGATSPQSGVVVVRALADRVEPAMQMLTKIWTGWRPLAWAMAACPPRVWRT